MLEIKLMLLLGILKMITKQQIKNRRKIRKWWRSFKKEGEIIFPFIIGVMILGFVGYLATTL